MFTQSEKLWDMLTTPQQIDHEKQHNLANAEHCQGLNDLQYAVGYNLILFFLSFICSFINYWLRLNYSQYFFSVSDTRFLKGHAW